MARKSAAALATPSIFSTKRPPPPDGLPPGAAALWVSICAGLDANYFSTGDLVLLESLVMADHQKRLCDALVLRDGPITADGINPAAKLAAQLAGTLATLATKLRLCKSATTRPESAGLKKSLHSGVKPWETSPEMAEYFND